MVILVTGAAGFIGFHLCKKLLEEKNFVIAFDNINNYYDIKIKNDRLEELKSFAEKYNSNFVFIKGDLENNNLMKDIFNKYKFNTVINLAAQAGVRYSLKNPSAYIQSNLVGFGNILENCKNFSVKHLIFASSSSVYGGSRRLPYKENQNVAHPVSLYAATKRSNELMAHTYSHLYNLRCTGLRFFTVYGPWGRPDMALFKFTRAILNDKEIEVFNNGNMIRDFTFIDDIIMSISLLIKKDSFLMSSFDYITNDPSKSWAPFRLFNIGNSNPIHLMEFINCLEKTLGKKAKKIFKDMQPGDVPETSADTSSLEEFIGFKPSTSVQEGIDRFVDWYKKYYKVIL